MKFNKLFFFSAKIWKIENQLKLSKSINKLHTNFDWGLVGIMIHMIILAVDTSLVITYSISFSVWQSFASQKTLELTRLMHKRQNDSRRVRVVLNEIAISHIRYLGGWTLRWFVWLIGFHDPQNIQTKITNPVTVEPTCYVFNIFSFIFVPYFPFLA